MTDWRRYWPVKRPPEAVEHERPHANELRFGMIPRWRWDEGWVRHFESWAPEGYRQWFWELPGRCYL